MANKKENVKAKSKTDWKRLKNIKDEAIDTSESAELDGQFWARTAVVRNPLKKKLISMRLDDDVIEWFKSTGPKYQTHMNQVLRGYMDWCKTHQTSKTQQQRHQLHH